MDTDWYSPTRKESDINNLKLFMRLACLAATRSKDKETKVGAVIVRNDREIVSTGYNGFVQRLSKEDDDNNDNDAAFSWEKESEDPLKKKELYVVHAEHNAILNTCGKDIRGCKLYVTLHPCNQCAKFVINSGISEVIYHEDRTDGRFEAAKRMFDVACSPVICRSYSEALRIAGEKCVADPTKFLVDENSKRPNWEQYFMAMATIAAERSRDPHTKVGAVIVNANNRVVGIGYNGMPWGCELALECTWDVTTPKSHKEDGWLRTKHPYVVHAVQMAIMNKNSADLTGCKLYVTLFPDNDCARSIIQSKIKEIEYLDDSKKDDIEMKASKKMLDWATVKNSPFNPEDALIKLRLVNEIVSLVPTDPSSEGERKWHFKSESIASESARNA